MIGSITIGLALVVIGVIVGVALPGAGWILALLALAIAILIVVRAFAGGREPTPKT
jgi:hypothetical protein